MDCIATGAKTVPDARQKDRAQMGIEDFYLSGFAMFFLQDPSLLEFQRRFEDQMQSNNLRTVFGIQQIPSDTHLRDLLDRQPAAFLQGVFTEYLRRLQRSKHLQRYEFLDEGYLLTLDGSEYFSSENVHCQRCLQRHKSDGRVEYYHQILQPAVVHPDLRQVLPLAPQFIRRQDGATKQDCEINAAKRLIKDLRREHPQLQAVVVGDSLYSTMPMIVELMAHRFPFLLVAKPDDHKSLFEDLNGLQRGAGLEKLLVAQTKGKRFLYEWVNQIPLGADPKSPSVNFVQLHIYDAKGQLTYRCSWVTDIALDKDNVQKVVRAARARWKIENEGFNTLKNQGYHLEHNFGHGSQHLSETLFLLNLLAYFVHQIQELVDQVYQLARAGFSSRMEFWNVMRGSFRMLLYASWEEVLSRITGPPLPAFPQSSPQN